jgi:ATP-dependent Clp protease ATP-binding subunit ClpB
MDFQKLTIKAQEAFASAQGDAIARGNPELTPDHLLAALIDQEGGVTARILEKAGDSPAAVRAAAEQRLAQTRSPRPAVRFARRSSQPSRRPRR